MHNKAQKRLRILIFASFLAAMGVVLGQYLSIKIGDTIRIGFGSLPVILAGCLFGPWVGLLVGGISDFVGCWIYYGLGNLIPLVTLGMMAEGFLAGLLCRRLKPLYLVLATAVSHTVGSIVIRTLGLYIRYKKPLAELIIRVPCGAIEIVLISIITVILLYRSHALTKALKGWRKERGDHNDDV